MSDDSLWVAWTEKRIKKEAILVAIDPAGCRKIIRIIGCRNLGGEIEYDTYFPLSTQVTQCLDGQAMSKQEMMGCRQRRRFVAPPWSVPPLEVPHQCRTPWLVQCDPERDSISQGTVDGSSILCKCLCRIPLCPTSFVLHRLRQVPVI